MRSGRPSAPGSARPSGRWPVCPPARRTCPRCAPPSTASAPAWWAGGRSGLSWVLLEGRDAAAADEAVAELRRDFVTNVLDAPSGSQAAHWGAIEPGVRDLMARVRAHFDPAGVCNPGALP